LGNIDFMKGLILAGGKGTRLRPLTVFTPKPVVPVVNKPFLLYQIDVLKRAGITDITLSLSYQPDKIEGVLNEVSDLGVEITFVTEPHPMGTGGAYRFAASSVNDTTIVFNGDILTDCELSKLIDFHKSKKAEATIALAPVEDPSRYGLVVTDDHNRVLKFLEKPKADEVNEMTVNTINAGVYILEPSILELIPEGENRSFEYNVFPEMLEKKVPFFGYIFTNEYWRDIGTPESYLQAHHDSINGVLKGFDIDRSSRADVATAATIDRVSVLGEGCVIKPSARILNSVLGPGVHVEEKAIIENSVIWSHTRISSFAEIRDAIIGRSCHIGRNAIVNAGTVLGDKASIPDYSRV
jgi:Nucleoside-diphosphate-sugar pyrophosphorylase involved in lipopolysaccharide biosynthesis/translation initiation factor 2B, gamma/epsilon subunits (eIF-2Bgamma/eIF-2Bepsilon)